MATHHFGGGTFKQSLWINGGAFFDDPVDVNVESVTPGAFVFQAVDEAGVVKCSLRHENAHGGWTSFDLPSLGVHGGRLKLGFLNAAPGERNIKQGDVRTKE